MRDTIGLRGGTKQVVYVDSEGQVIELFVATGTPWQWTDLTALTAAPRADQGSLAGYDWLNGNTKQVIDVDDQGHVVELCVGLNGQWQSANFTALVRRRAAKKAAPEETGLKA